MYTNEFQNLSLSGLGMGCMRLPDLGKYSDVDQGAVERMVAYAMEQLDELLEFPQATEQERDYSVIGSFTADTISGTCVYCNHCQPCPAGIDIGLVNKYYDLALAGDRIAANHYDKLSTKADACLQCGHCESRCPFGVEQMTRMTKIAEYFGT